MSECKSLATGVGGGALLTGDGQGVVRAWDWRHAGGGALATAAAHAGPVTAVVPLSATRRNAVGPTE